MAKKVSALAVLLILGSALCLFAVSVRAATPIADKNKTTAEVLDGPIVRMKNWKFSSPEEQKSFLMGLVTMIGVNKYWMEKNHSKIYPESPTAIWVRALDGVTYADMIAALDQYANDTANNLDVSVVEVLWRKFCAPVATAK